jgi:hypothetical protein
MIPESEKMIDLLILNGALEPTGVHEETGELLFSFTEKLEEVSPELYNKLTNAFHLEILGLWEKGFLEIDMTSENPLVALTKKALDVEAVKDLDENEEATLQSVIRAMQDYTGA